MSLSQEGLGRDVVGAGAELVLTGPTSKVLQLIGVLRLDSSLTSEQKIKLESF